MSVKPTRHPARFTDVILERAAALLAHYGPHGERRLYDPFAGTGKGVDFMALEGYRAIGTELEPEWAAQSPRVWACNAFAFMEAKQLDVAEGTEAPFDVVFTSPAYGNRMADHHEAKDSSRRNTYRHALGRPLSEGSAAGLQWGDAYREFHKRAWRDVLGVLRPGGYFLLNVKDHIRAGRQVHVADWHRMTVRDLGLDLVESCFVETPGNRQGQNGSARVPGEWLLLFRKPEA